MRQVHLLQAILVTVCVSVSKLTSATDIQSVAPVIVLDGGTFVGVGNGVTHRFLGIPFAKPPYVSTLWTPSPDDNAASQDR